MDDITDKIVNAAKYSFSKIIENIPNETIYAFILYTDEDCYTILPAANSLEKLKEKMLENENGDPISLAECKWSSAEWAYEAAHADKFVEISRALSEASGKAVKSGNFNDFKARTHHCMINALQRMDKENFFDNRRDGLILYISSSDHDESIKIEDFSAKKLNSKQKYEPFLRRYG